MHVCIRVLGLHVCRSAFPDWGPLMPALLPNLCCLGHTAPPGRGGIWASVQLTLDEPRLARTQDAVAVRGMRLGGEVGE